jgi:hypothetical protein
LLTETACHIYGAGFSQTCRRVTRRRASSSRVRDISNGEPAKEDIEAAKAIDKIVVPSAR